MRSFESGEGDDALLQALAKSCAAEESAEERAALAELIVHHPHASSTMRERWRALVLRRLGLVPRGDNRLR